MTAPFALVGVRIDEAYSNEIAFGPTRALGIEVNTIERASQMLCRESLELCTTAKAMCLESKEACLESKHAREASAAQRKTYAPLNGTLSRMKLKLFLDKDSYECLLNHLPHQAPSRAAINAAVLLGNTRIVDCDDVEARDLLSSAQGYCLGAVRGIAQAMRSAGLTP